MCIAAPGKVVEVKKKEVVVEYPGVAEKRRAMLSGDKVKVGDMVMVQMGIVVKVLSAEEAHEVKQAWGVEAVAKD